MKIIFLGKQKSVQEESKDVLMDMKSYMHQMDKELAKTDVGQSFERLPHQAPVVKKDEVRYVYILKFIQHKYCNFMC